MKRRLSIVLALIIACSVLFTLPLGVSAESLYIRKIVSVVYDDSGSMRGDKWAYANYAMQTFAGMLNSEDQLYITYMSEPTTSNKVDLSASQIQSSIDKIRTRAKNSDTPYTAVTTAYDKLKSVQDANSHTQYWLVVLTDGDFNEMSGMEQSDKKDFLNGYFDSYVSETMPNGSHAQATFFGIGGVTVPDEDESKGIHVYTPQSANDITDAMNEMADKISGRTRLQSSDITSVDEQTVKISSSIPLLNIAVFMQKTDATVTAVTRDGSGIPIGRTATLSVPTNAALVGSGDYSSLNGSACLVGDSVQIIQSGEYVIAFSEAVSKENIVILYEPALELKTQITVNDFEKEPDELNETVAGDTLSISAKIVEMGTGNEIQSDKLPTGTQYAVEIYENGNKVQEKEGTLSLNNYELKNVPTKIVVRVSIPGFNPIEYKIEFTPLATRPDYEIVSVTYSKDDHTLKLDEIATNTDFTVTFVIEKDGEPIPAEEIDDICSVDFTQGNDGTEVYYDGAVVVTPNFAPDPNGFVSSYQVEITCTLSNGTKATAEYTVHVAQIGVVLVDANAEIKKTEVNGKSVAFYFTKDGAKLSKAELDAVGVDKNTLVSLGAEYAGISLGECNVADDGTVTVVLCAEETREITFKTWWTNWWYYWNLESDDIALAFTLGEYTADGRVQVVGEDAKYLLLNVFAPLILEAIALILLIIWIVLIITKPRFTKNAVLYVGDISYGSDGKKSWHVVSNFHSVQLSKYNALAISPKANKIGRIKPKKTADAVSVDRIILRPKNRYGKVVCENSANYQWLLVRISRLDGGTTNPDELVEAMLVGDVQIDEISPIDSGTVVDGNEIKVGEMDNAEYYVIPTECEERIDRKNKNRRKSVIVSGKVFIYIKK